VIAPSNCVNFRYDICKMTVLQLLAYAA